jgi:magnesium-transporting ATPase (P-type)
MSRTVTEPDALIEQPDSPWYTLEADAALELLTADAHGLSEEEAASRLERIGPNEIEAAVEDPLWKLLLHQFTDPLIYILLIAAAVMALLEHYTDVGVILVVVLVNAIIGFTQEQRARTAMRALARMSAPKAEVIREGRPREIPSRDLVPGDVVSLTSGARVPADLRLLHVRELEINESALTGESAPARKATEALGGRNLVPGDQKNLAFSGTVVTRGRGRGVVIRTASATEIGRIATAVREVGRTVTPLQLRMEQLGRRIGLAIVAFCAVVAAIGLWQGMPLEEIFIAAVALAVASIPEGLPIVLTVTLAIGVSRMARRRAIVRALPAVETLGSTTVIGSDKTGTLTKNQMTVRSIFAGGETLEVTGVGYATEGMVVRDGAPIDPSDSEPLRVLLTAGVLANEADPDGLRSGDLTGDPTEIALHVSAAKAGVDPSETRRHHPELDIVPFESERRFMATLNSGSDGRRIYVKGAPETILARCFDQLGPDGPEPLDAERIREEARRMAGSGLRVLAMAFRASPGESIPEPDLDQGFTFAGLQGMEDPLRPEAVEAVAAAHSAGIRVVMLTGDHSGTATAIGRQLGLDPAGTGAVDGSELQEMSDEELREAVKHVNVFARVAPEHKLRIVEQLKGLGEVVAVTGDGVNDAPALRAAHLGIAMGRSGTDVAREASDMVLADDNFATITAAVEEGRVVFANIRKVTFFLLSTAVGQILLILTTVALGWPLPLLAAQILWINLVTNGLQDVALAFEPGEPGLLRQKPRKHKEGIVNLRIIERLGGVGVLLAAGTLGMFWWAWTLTDDLDYARTVALTQMVVFQFFHVFNCRSLDRSILSIPLFSNRFLFLSVVAAGTAHMAALHVPFLQGVFRTMPIEPDWWGWIFLVGSTVILGGEADKWLNRKRGRALG